MQGVLKEFKQFAMRGNVLDLAIGVILGGAFGKIVSSFVADILMPPIGLVLGKVDFSSLFLALDGSQHPSLDAARKAGAPTLNYGVFVNQVIDFVIVAFAIFLVVKAVNRLHQPAPAVAAAPATRDCPYCLSAIPLRASKCAHCASALPAA